MHTTNHNTQRIHYYYHSLVYHYYYYHSWVYHYYYSWFDGLTTDAAACLPPTATRSEYKHS